MRIHNDHIKNAQTKENEFIFIYGYIHFSILESQMKIKLNLSPVFFIFNASLQELTWKLINKHYKG